MLVACRYYLFGFNNLTPCLALNSEQRTRIERSPLARERIASFQIMNVDFYPRESHVVTFRDPWSFPILFHPACNNLIRGHLQEIAQRVSEKHGVN